MVRKETDLNTRLMSVSCKIAGNTSCGSIALQDLLSSVHSSTTWIILSIGTLSAVLFGEPRWGKSHSIAINISLRTPFLLPNTWFHSLWRYRHLLRLTLGENRNNYLWPQIYVTLPNVPARTIEHQRKFATYTHECLSALVSSNSWQLAVRLCPVSRIRARLVGHKRTEEQRTSILLLTPDRLLYNVQWNKGLCSW